MGATKRVVTYTLANNSENCTLHTRLACLRPQLPPEKAQIIIYRRGSPRALFNQPTRLAAADRETKARNLSAWRAQTPELSFGTRANYIHIARIALYISPNALLRKFARAREKKKIERGACAITPRRKVYRLPLYSRKTFRCERPFAGPARLRNQTSSQAAAHARRACVGFDYAR